MSIDVEKFVWNKGDISYKIQERLLALLTLIEDGGSVLLIYPDYTAAHVGDLSRGPDKKGLQEIQVALDDERPEVAGKSIKIGGGGVADSFESVSRGDIRHFRERVYRIARDFLGMITFYDSDGKLHA